MERSAVRANHDWELVGIERAKLAEILGNLSTQQWQESTLCDQWQVRDVVAHLAAAGATGTGAWLVNMLSSGFNTDRHNDRLLGRYLGSDPEATRENFEQTVHKTVAPLNSAHGLLTEIIVHGQDIAVPLGIKLEPSRQSLRLVASFMATKNFAVNSHTLVKDLRISATDYPFAHGEGPAVTGKLLDLVMVMAGRKNFVAKLDGEGAAQIGRRLS
ncbi:maleylpyruvate isomerase family mycothiol-dependent enzyme [Glutamicibacter sp. M10]|uniref:maleylpyruvate isomerase family mycothiol-dependent enzyme n=1 Tax=Glutamicibacter sp. M10 TaxID=3023076 RepID=UPI0021C88DD4|nr:maleylpyruvate isomerase family mycothiol-dependent enzyme [Glutamicibacter sp. M10]UXN31663.1 maleylpyruvate isomerase family mycothiol-dependent enzyme [Glutamicibacter sp. M10]